MTNRPYNWTQEDRTPEMDQLANDSAADLEHWQNFATIIQAEMKTKYNEQDARIIKNALIQFSITGVTRFDPFICGFFLDHNLLMDRAACKVAALAVQDKPITHEVIFNLYKDEAEHAKNKPNR